MEALHDYENINYVTSPMDTSSSAPFGGHEQRKLCSSGVNWPGVKRKDFRSDAGPSRGSKV